MLVDFLLFQLLEQLAHPNKTTCAKDLETALHCKGEGNEAFGQSLFPQALDSYTKVHSQPGKCFPYLIPVDNHTHPYRTHLAWHRAQALRYVPLGADADVAILATLFVNRAAALHVCAKALLGSSLENVGSY